MCRRPASLILRILIPVFFLIFGVVSTGRTIAVENNLLPAERKAVTVWAIAPSKVYHCPASRWYGKTKDGKYMPECQAIREGYRPAFGHGCGSECP